MAITGAIAGVALIGGTLQAQQQMKQQKRAMAMQQQAQEQAAAAAAQAQRRAEMEQKAANMKAPDLGGLLTDSQQNALKGPGSTMLSGPGGVVTSAFTLGKTSLLGS
jgi:transcription initiation factor TFIID subunit TAF12